MEIRQKLVPVNEAVLVTALSMPCCCITLRALHFFVILRRKSETNLKDVQRHWKIERQYQHEYYTEITKIIEHSTLIARNSDSPANKSCEICTLNLSFGIYKYAYEVTPELEKNATCSHQGNERLLLTSQFKIQS